MHEMFISPAGEIDGIGVTHHEARHADLLAEIIRLRVREELLCQLELIHASDVPVLQNLPRRRKAVILIQIIPADGK